jgi:hypothetical protein
MNVANLCFASEQPFHSRSWVMDGFGKLEGAFFQEKVVGIVARIVELTLWFAVWVLSKDMTL